MGAVPRSGGDSHESELLTDVETLLSAFQRNVFTSAVVVSVLVEALLLALLGALIGAAIGILSACVIGLLGGLLPAARAARLSVAAAIRG